MLQVANVSDVGDVQAATPESRYPLPTREPPAHKLIRTPQLKAEAPGPHVFLLIGLGLIVVRFIISYRSRKVKNLATGTH